MSSYPLETYRQPTYRQFHCWLIDFAKPDHSEDMGVSSVLVAVDAEHAAAEYAEEYDLSYGTADVGTKPLRIGTVEVLSRAPKLIEVQLNEDPVITWTPVVANREEQFVFKLFWSLIHVGLWGQEGRAGMLRGRARAPLGKVG